MDGKLPKLWDQDVDPSKALRLPNTPVLRRDDTNNTGRPKLPTELHRNTASTENNVVSNSRLSVDAPEFYPSSYSNNSFSGAKPSVQNRLKKHKQGEAGDVTQAFQNIHLNGSSDQQQYGDDFMHNSQDGTRLRHVISTLTTDPEQFDNLLDIFLETLLPYYDNCLVLSQITQVLVEQAISHPTFRYSAAKLCCIIEQQCPLLRAALRLTCEKELDRNPNKGDLILFVAELYTQLHYDNIYASYLIDAFKQLLDTGGNNNVKCVCQALKLTGYSLDLYNQSALDNVLAKLLQLKPTVSGTPLCLIDSVVNLRSLQWGRSSSQVPNNNSSNMYYEQEEEEHDDWPQPENNTIFYNPDGLKLSAEERAFLAENFHSPDEYFLDTSDPDELYNPEPEMDEEIQAAFKDFVKMSKR